MTNANYPRIGYVPYNATLRSPGDRRRFVAYTKARNLPFELADPEEVYDFVVLSEVADISVWADYPHGKVIFDLIDSYLAIPRTDVKQWLRGFVAFAMRRHKRLRLNYWSAIKDMCWRSDAVVCTTEEQKATIERYCPNVNIILDIHSQILNTTKNNYRSSEPFNLVWEGLPFNVVQLQQIRSVFKKIDEGRPLVLNIVTDLSYPRLLGRFGQVRTIDLAKKVFDHVRLYAWEEGSLAEIVCGCDLAVIPIDLSDPFTTGKPENKLLLFWRMGMPAVTSATPAYQRAMKAIGFDAFACRDTEEWVVAIERMMLDENFRRQAGTKGRDFAESHHGPEKMIARWDEVFASLGFTLSDLKGQN